MKKSKSQAIRELHQMHGAIELMLNSSTLVLTLERIEAARQALVTNTEKLDPILSDDDYQTLLVALQHLRVLHLHDNITKTMMEL